jgi:hypothetical protein
LPCEAHKNAPKAFFIIRGWCHSLYLVAKELPLPVILIDFRNLGILQKSVSKIELKNQVAFGALLIRVLDP